jgi:hypothetical protein
MPNGHNLYTDIPTGEPTESDGPTRDAPKTAKLRRFFTVIMAGTFIGVALTGCAVFDRLRMWTTTDRKVHFWVVKGEVDENSVRVNGWFQIPDGELDDETSNKDYNRKLSVAQGKAQRFWFPSRPMEAGRRLVFSFPFTEGVDPIWCTYKDGGYTWKEKQPGPYCDPPQ